jgi:hypothetical protein
MANDLQLSLLHTDSFPRVERELLTVETSPFQIIDPVTGVLSANADFNTWQSC